MAVGQEHLIEPSTGSVKFDDAEPTWLDEEVEDEALTLSDFDADIGKGAADDLSNGTFYPSTEELIAGLSELGEAAAPSYLCYVAAGPRTPLE